MTTGATLDFSLAYKYIAGSGRWEGRVVDDTARFRWYLRDVVRPRIADEASPFEADLRGLATTGLETRFVERVLCAVQEPKGWEVGEALAECALRDDAGREVHWPWNTVRDRRTPRASLPGADLVGFCCREERVLLLFGEVKTSSDGGAPPGVMRGGSGMAWQLEQSSKRLDIQHALLKWLHARCRSRHSRALYKEAVQRYLASEGQELVLVGILMRAPFPASSI